jgi:hypothetical protein
MPRAWSGANLARCFCMRGDQPARRASRALEVCTDNSHRYGVSGKRPHVLRWVIHKSVGVGTSSRTVRCGPCAGPTFHSCPDGTRLVQRLGNGVDYGHGALVLILDRLLFRPDVCPVGADRASVYALPPVAATRRWLLPLLSPLLSAQCEWFGTELLLGDHRRALGFPVVFCRSKRARAGAPVSQIAITD